MSLICLSVFAEILTTLLWLVIDLVIACIDPIRHVCGELVPQPVVVIFDAFHESDVAFLDQVGEGQAGMMVFFRN